MTVVEGGGATVCEVEVLVDVVEVLVEVVEVSEVEVDVDVVEVVEVSVEVVEVEVSVVDVSEVVEVSGGIVLQTISIATSLTAQVTTYGDSAGKGQPIAYLL